MELTLPEPAHASKESSVIKVTGQKLSGDEDVRLGDGADEFLETSCQEFLFLSDTSKSAVHKPQASISPTRARELCMAVSQMLLPNLQRARSHMLPQLPVPRALLLRCRGDDKLVLRLGRRRPPLGGLWRPLRVLCAGAVRAHHSEGPAIGCQHSNCRPAACSPVHVAGGRPHHHQCHHSNYAGELSAHCAAQSM